MWFLRLLEAIETRWYVKMVITATWFLLQEISPI